MDEKKSLDERILAARNQLILCGDAMLFAYHMLVELKYGAEVDQEKFQEYLISALYELGASKQNN